MSRFAGTLRQKAEKLGLDGDMVYQRVHRGWTEEEALCTPYGDRRPDRVSTVAPLMAQPGTMMVSEALWRVSGDDKRADIVNKLISGEE